MATVQNGKLFSCGNHSVETTKGMLHFGEPSETVCILEVPSTMTIRDVVHFLNPSMQDIENTRIFGEVNHDSSYIVLITFRNLESAQEFYLNYDGIQFNSLEEHTCQLLYVTRVETFAEDPAKIEDNPNCAVCLDRMHADVESIITILCNHSFHAHCLSQWSDTSCPVCRYCQTPQCSVENKCMVCSYEGEELWMCIICGHVACGRYVNGHANEHFNQTQHTYAMKLADNRVWDYVGDHDVHRLLANKSDGKPVEVEGVDSYRLIQEKEAMHVEYSIRLEQQLESQKKYYEKMIKAKEDQFQKKLDDATNKLKKASDDLKELQEQQEQLLKDKTNLQKIISSFKSKFAKIQSSLDEEKQMNKCLAMNQEQLQKELEEKKKRLAELEEQQQELLFHITGRDKIIDSVNSNEYSRAELDEAQLIVPTAASTSSRGAASKNNRRKKR